MTRNGSILVVNSGSSSIKLALFAMAEAEPSSHCTGTVERIGLDRGRVIVSDNEGAVITDESRRNFRAPSCFGGRPRGMRLTEVDRLDASVDVHGSETR